MKLTKRLLVLSVGLNAALAAAVIWLCIGGPARSRGGRRAEPVTVQTLRYGSFPLVRVGDTVCGTIPKSSGLRYDCGPLAGVYAGSKGDALTSVRHEAGGERWRVSTKPGQVAASLVAPPDVDFSPAIRRYYPINVFSADEKANEQELLAVAFEIEAALLGAELEGRR